MHFDDLELLRSILKDELTPTGALFSGFSLIQTVASGTVLDHPNDYRAFAKELLLARDAGFLEFDEGAWSGSPGVNPAVDAHQWLQQISNIHLTLAGRDRAQGRVIVRPMPEPNEDDGRPVAGMTLEEVARAIGDTYNALQIPKFLTDSGIPPEYIPINQGDSKWEYVLLILERLDQVGSASRRALREFIGAWLDNRLHTVPEDDVRRRILRQLGQQGWAVRDGRLVVGPPQAAVPEAPPSGSRAERFARLHPTIREASQRYLETHLEVAIFEAFKAVNKRVKEMTALDADGSDLMAKAFADKEAPLQLGDSSDTGRNIQSGYRFLFMGAVRGIRNRDAHELFVPLSDEEAFEQLGLASLLMRRLDDVAERRAGSQPRGEAESA
ncbi:MAG: TIGR02391 family protein [Candidatus Dormibacteria bacterium]